MLNSLQIIYFLIIRLVKTLYYFLREFIKVLSFSIFNQPNSYVEYAIFPSKKTIYLINSMVACSSTIFHLMKLGDIKRNLLNTINNN